MATTVGICRFCTKRPCCVISVAKVRPSRYIRAGASLKLLASKSTKFYKTPTTSPASSRSRAVFFLHGTSSAAHCPCLQAAGVVTAGHRPGRAGRDDGKDDSSLLVAGRLEEVIVYLLRN